MDVLRYYRAKLGWGTESKGVIDEAPSAEHRALLQARGRVLHAAITGTRDRASVQRRLLEMLVAFDKKADERETIAMVNKYADVLEDLPVWAIMKACAEIERGQAAISLDYFPTAPRLRDVVHGLAIVPVHREYVDISNVLTARVRAPDTPEQARQLEIKTREWIDGKDPIRRDLKEEVLRDQHEAWDRVKVGMVERRDRAILAEYAAHGEEPCVTGPHGVLISRSLRDQIRGASAQKKGADPA